MKLKEDMQLKKMQIIRHVGGVDMIEIRWHGRGGQGAFTASRLLGGAAIHEGKYAQAFPSFGPERRGTPVLAFTRISDEPIYDHSELEMCDYVVVLDDTLYNPSIYQGLKKEGILLINTTKDASAFKESDFSVMTIDATSIALEIIKRPITNVPMAGALAAATGVVKLDSINKAIDEQLAVRIREKNKQLLDASYSSAKGGN